jgi:hypothetical protein
MYNLYNTFTDLMASGKKPTDRPLLLGISKWKNRVGSKQKQSWLWTITLLANRL